VRFIKCASLKKKIVNLVVMQKRNHNSGSAIIRDVILGGQDGIVNVLGIVLAVATATHSKYIILISGLAATFAESISMAAVGYTSAKAGKEFYVKKGFKHSMFEEFAHPVRDSVIIGVAAIVGSLIPVVPFFFLPIGSAWWAALVFATAALFGIGFFKAKQMGINPWKSGTELAVVGMTAAIAGYVIGALLGALPLG